MTTINPVESAITETKTPRARDRYYFCAALINDKIVAEPVMATDEAEATASFSSKFGVAPSTINAGSTGLGWHDVKGTGNLGAEKVSVTLSAEQLLKRTGAAWKGTFRNWNVLASGVSSCTVGETTYDDNEVVAIILRDRVAGTNDRKPKLPQNPTVLFSALENVEPLV